jgi:hypothetical protein
MWVHERVEGTQELRLVQRPAEAIAWTSEGKARLAAEGIKAAEAAAPQEVVVDLQPPPLREPGPASGVGVGVVGESGTGPTRDAKGWVVGEGSGAGMGPFTAFLGLTVLGGLALGLSEWRAGTFDREIPGGEKTNSTPLTPAPAPAQYDTASTPTAAADSEPVVVAPVVEATLTPTPSPPSPSPPSPDAAPAVVAAATGTSSSDAPAATASPLAPTAAAAAAATKPFSSDPDAAADTSTTTTVDSGSSKTKLIALLGLSVAATAALVKYAKDNKLL